MDTERWNQLETFLHEARALPAAQRPAYVQLVCNGDETLQQYLSDLLLQPQPDTDPWHLAETTAPHDASALTAEIPRAVETHPQNQTRQLDQYRLLELLGRGGMGEVYLAEDQQLGKRVAIKLLSAAFSQDAQHIARFQREARMLALAQHPNIAEAYLLREHARGHYLVMEFVPGETLAQRLQRGALPVHEALPFLRQIAAALQAAHERKVIHRDLKPDNIKLTPDGTVKLLDFGLAKQLRAELTTHDEELLAQSVFSTQRKVVAGTVPYMSPEQTRAEDLDARSDLWSFGCVAFEMLTGVRPFAGMNTHELFQAIRTQSPAWTLLPAATPPALRQMLQQCLRKERQARLASASDAVAALSQASTFALRQARQRVWRKRALVAALVLVCATSAFYRRPLWQFVQAGLRPNEALAARSLPHEKRLLIAPFKEKDVSAAFGKHLALALQDSLREVPGLQVMPYAEMLRLPTRNAVTAESLRPLGVNLVLTGEVEQQGDKLFVRYWLDDARGQRLMSSKQIETAPQLPAARSRLVADVVLTLLQQQPPLPAPNVLQNPASQQQYFAARAALQDDLTPATLRTVIEGLENLRQTEPPAVPVLTTLAEAQLRLAKEMNDRKATLAAQRLTEEALHLDVNDSAARLLRGRLRLHGDDYAGALQDTREALRRRPSDVDALHQLGEILFYSEQWAEAERAYQTVVALWPGYWGGHNDLGAFYFDRGRYPEAAAAWRQVISLNPASGSGYVNLGNVYLQLGQLNEAVTLYEQARRQHGIESESALEAFIGLGAAHYYLRQYEEAAARSSEGLLPYPENPTLFGNRADALRRMTGHEAEAAQDYSRAIALLERSQQTAEGRATLAELRAKRSVITARYALADKQMPVSQTDQLEARRQIQMAVREGAAFLEVQLRALLVYQLLGETDKALNHFRQALQLGLAPALLEKEPDLDQLRLDGRYNQLIQQYKIQPR